jgi:hypothetical protein
MQITIPDSATMLGLGSKTEVRLINDTPLYGTVMSMNENLGNFDPGATLVSATSFALEYSPVLVAVLFYETAARDRVVGIAIGETWVRRGEVQSKVFRIQDIRFLNGSNAVYRDMYPAPQKGTNREVDAPMMGLMSTTWVLWANASLFDVEVDIGGKEQRILPAGGLYWMQITNVSEVNRQIVTKMTCLDGGRVRRDIREERFTPGHGYPMVRTFLMDAYWFPRY